MINDYESGFILNQAMEQRDDLLWRAEQSYPPAISIKVPQTLINDEVNWCSSESEGAVCLLNPRL